MTNIYRVIVLMVVLFLSGRVFAERSNLTDEEKLANGWVVKDISCGCGGSLVTVNVKALINSAPDKVWKLLSDINRWSSWMPVLSRGFVVENVPDSPEKVKEVYDQFSKGQSKTIEINNEGVTTVDTFEEFDLPWPVNDDWVLRRYIFDSASATAGEYKVDWKQLFNGTEGRGGSWRVSRYNGSESETLFEYHFRVKRKDSVPKSVFEFIIGETIDRFINAIRKNV